MEASDNINDLALLSSSATPPTTASFQKGVRLGDAVFVYGFPLSGLLSSTGNFTSGTVTSLAGLHDDSRMLQISAPVQPGNSGGPLLSETGAVIGVVTAKLDAITLAGITKDIPQNVNFAIKGSAAQTFLESNSIAVASVSDDAVRLQPGDIAEFARNVSVKILCVAQRPRPPGEQDAVINPPANPNEQRAPSTLVESSAPGQWAIGNSRNCSLPSKSYSLTADGGYVTWRDGVGDIDIETIVSSSATEFSATTSKSIHKNGASEPRGMLWTYSRTGADSIRVTPEGKNSFLLVRCPR